MLITWVVSLAAVRSYKPDQGFYHFLALEMQAMFMIELIFLAIGLLLGCAMQRYKLSGSTTIGIVLATYFMSVMSVMQETKFPQILHPVQVFRRGSFFAAASWMALICFCQR